MVHGVVWFHRLGSDVQCVLERLGAALVRRVGLRGL